MSISSSANAESEISCYGICVSLGSGAAVFQTLARGEASSKCIFQGVLTGLGHQITQRRESYELPVGKEVRELLQSVVWGIEVARILGDVTLGNIQRSLHSCCFNVFVRRRDVETSPLAFANHGDEMRTDAPRPALFSYVVEVHRGAVGDRHGTLPGYRPVRITFRALCIVPDLVADLTIDDRRLDPRLLAFLLAQPPRVDEGYFDGVCRVGTLHRPRPQPSDHRVLGTARRCDLGVQTPDPGLGLVPNPFSIAADILG
ncbi:hypothetical protein BN1051_03044 [Arthrobacter saudimassiliensis]|uniref:Uncharacterized protein n=1 Tax=Arthrobacter saudimassiliensis TaxID=1461584 RepID=A0A078MW79_9MICC|nr:hypothetical protein BN1051_03044 [Arthrobacter saudimassiliensis]